LPNQDPLRAALIGGVDPSGVDPARDSRAASALGWIRSHPRRFLTLTVFRMVQFWFPDVEGFTAVHGFSVAFASVAAFLGIALMLRRRTPIAPLATTIPQLHLLD
jgi:hypothetical protein